MPTGPTQDAPAGPIHDPPAGPQLSLPDYENDYPLVPPGRQAIRLIQIQPRPKDSEGLPSSTPIELKMRVVILDPETQLLNGENAEPAGRPSPRGLGRLAAKFKPAPDLRPVPLCEIPEGEPKTRDRFKWEGLGNYVAMSYSWGRKEEWEMTEKDREDARKTAVRHEEEDRERIKLNPAYVRPPPEDDYHGTYPYDDNDVHFVLLDGKRVGVRYNLWAALLAFREMTIFKDGMWLWNDALCINQQPTPAGKEDRAIQLPLMSLIYRQAGNVIVHLGGGYYRNENTPWVLEYMQDIGANYRTEYYEALDHADPTVAHSHRFQAKLELEKSAKEWVEDAQADIRTSARQADTDATMISLYDFFDRPYWRRLWIIQELSMAHHSAPILCGDYVTQWRYVRDAALLLCMMADTVRDAMQRALSGRGRKMMREPSFEHVAAIAELAFAGNRRQIPRTNEILFMLQPGVLDVEKHRGGKATGVSMPLLKTLDQTPIHQALTLAADASCGWDRDRVLGLLAIPALRERLPLRNDQDFARLPATDIYIQFAKACIEADHSLDIFSILEGGWQGPDDDVRRNLPSWCPRFHIKTKIGRIEGDCWHAQPRFPKYDRYNFESIEFEEEMAPKFEGENMIVPGWVIDTVDALGAISASDMPNVNPGRLPLTFAESWPENDDGFLYRRNFDFIEANKDLPIAGEPFSSYFKRQPVSNFSTYTRSTTGEHAYHQIAGAHRAMEARTNCRRMMTTSKQPLMGLVPAATQQGDIVIILWYHSRPLIASCIIPDGADEDSDEMWFRIKGEAFIPGVMDGELADQGILDALPMTKFVFI
ncbi:heterokaryon incompatibility protein-domain-containing protein [Schizothecium vesticola]|uniref:Heterokaryon incompatibility protein-domain-containing protein n=1 Tax=Schizothecium vesticola TaxID=314040 RepID=A0AA40FCB4_9PEZI|nr:heterokaryon incompatibility protein-domain-containing protein [Schizothecium vesticola]